jgi:hypothetical protein
VVEVAVVVVEVQHGMALKKAALLMAVAAEVEAKAITEAGAVVGARVASSLIKPHLMVNLVVAAALVALVAVALAHLGMTAVAVKTVQVAVATEPVAVALAVVEVVEVTPRLRVLMRT